MNTRTVATSLALLLLIPSAAFSSSASGPSAECLGLAEEFKTWLLAEAEPAPDLVVAWFAALAQPCGFDFAPGLESPRTATGDTCEGGGAGQIEAAVVVLGVRSPLRDDPAGGDFSRAGFSSIQAEGPVYGLTANSAGAAIIRVGAVGIPAIGSADTTCGFKTSKVCKKIWLWEPCVDVVSMIACRSAGAGEIGVSGVVTLRVTADLTNPVGCDLPVELGKIMLDDLALT